MTKDEALKLALEALEDLGMKHYESTGEVLYKETFAAIKEALAQPEQSWTPERIAGMARLKEAQDKKLAQPEQPKVRTGNCLRVGVCASEGHKIQPQRTWVGLTDEELQPIADEYRILFGGWVKDFAQAIEAKLKEKNERTI